MEVTTCMYISVTFDSIWSIFSFLSRIPIVVSSVRSIYTSNNVASSELWHVLNEMGVTTWHGSKYTVMAGYRYKTPSDTYELRGEGNRVSFRLRIQIRRKSSFSLLLHIDAFFVACHLSVGRINGFVSTMISRPPVAFHKNTSP